MSLLMDALKKAEQAKRLARTEGDASPAESARELELAPLDGASGNGDAVPRGRGTPLPPVQIFDEDLYPPAQAHTEAPSPTMSSRSGDKAKVSATAQAQQEAAQALFEAKEPAGGNKVFAIGIGLFTLIAVAAIGVYFWLQLQPPSSGLLATTPPPATRPVTPPPSAEPHREVVATTTSEPKAKQTAKVPTRRDNALAQRSELPPSEAPIRITTARLRVDPSLSRGYDDLAKGDLAAARAEYEQLLKAEPKNGDALLGMATVAVRQGRTDQAEAYYLRALEADPKNAQALAGLASLNGDADPVQAESRLKTQLAGQPEVPALHFALGNVYVRQGRWNEAQQAFFKAYTLDAGNPDYIFNLAVSLDQLRQPNLAAEYYNRAMTAAESRPFGFDRAQVVARLRDLQR